MREGKDDDDDDDDREVGTPLPRKSNKHNFFFLFVP
jgi:hypothetical protein